jgi:phospholipid/cholesterol/gamma-HCH transport system substrate-binding protein
VTAITFDERPNQPDGVLVTLSLERRYKVRAGSTPRITRSLIGDVTIDMLPGTGPGLLATSTSPHASPVIEGEVAPDPSKALAAATVAFEKAGNTLGSIDKAAAGIAKLTSSADKLPTLIDDWSHMGKRVAAAADSIDRLLRTNENDFQPALANLRAVSQKLNAAFDPKAQAALKDGIDRFATAAARLDASLAQIAPLFKDLGAPVQVLPTTNFGQAAYRLNRVISDVSLLSRTLSDGHGALNRQGSLQKLVTHPELYDNINRMATTATEAFTGFKPILASFRAFAKRIADDPAVLARGALQR